MGKVVYAPGIQYVKGSLARPKKIDGHNHGDYLIGTHREAESTNPDCTRLYIRKADAYNRSTPVGENEAAARTKFAAIARAVAERAQDLSKKAADIAAFKAQKDEPGGKKTMKSYLWSLEAATYDQTNP